MERDELLKQLDNKSKCPECGVPNQCAIEAGKSASACWCVTFPPSELKPVGSCLCKSCLSQHISTPCVKKCKLIGKRCTGCNRTMEQIKNAYEQTKK